MTDQNKEFDVSQIDWNLEWKKARQKMSTRRQRGDAKGFWNSTARRYDEIDNNAQGRAARIVDAFKVDSDTSIIDIGCGTGQITISLARKAGRVTALDPSEDMLGILDEKARQENLSNITILNNKWEDVAVGVDLEPHDLVVSSYSLVMDDVRDAIAKMESAARQGVCIFWFASKASYEFDALWPRLFGTPHVPGPNHAQLLNVLHQMKIFPNVGISSQTHIQRFKDLDDATDHWAGIMRIEEPAQREIIREHLGRTLVPKEGKLLSIRPVASAMIWWRTDE